LFRLQQEGVLQRALQSFVKGKVASFRRGYGANGRFAFTARFSKLKVKIHYS